MNWIKPDYCCFEKKECGDCSYHVKVHEIYVCELPAVRGMPSLPFPLSKEKEAAQCKNT